MTDIIEARGTIEVIEICAETRWTFVDLEGAEEANKTVEELKQQVAEWKLLAKSNAEIDNASQAVHEVREEYLTATELVVEQMRENNNRTRQVLIMMHNKLSGNPSVLNIKHIEYAVECIDNLQLQPSLSALREYEAKVLENAIAKGEMKRKQTVGGWNGLSFNAGADSVLGELRRMASELCAKGE
jgi:hypothetical protein